MAGLVASDVVFYSKYASSSWPLLLLRLSSIAQTSPLKTHRGYNRPSRRLCGDLLAPGIRLETISLADKTDRLARLCLEGSCSARAWLLVRVPNH